MTFLTDAFLIDIGQVSDLFLTLIRLDLGGTRGLALAQEELAQFQVLMIKEVCISLLSDASRGHVRSTDPPTPKPGFRNGERL